MNIYGAIVIGCGKIGSNFTVEAQIPGVHSHAEAYQKHPRIQLLGLSDLDITALSKAEKLWGVKTSVDPLTLCHNLNPDIISICTPDETHFPLAESLLKTVPPRLLFIEKPLALRAVEAEKLLKLAQEKRCTIAVNYSRRFSPAFQKLKQELQSGQHGKPILMSILYGKGLLHNGSHGIDLMRFWLGDPIETQGKEVAWGLPGDETYSVDFKFSHDCRGRLEGFDERVATVFEMDFLTEQSRWRFWLGGQQWEFSQVSESPLYQGYKNYIPNKRHLNDPLFTRPLSDCLWYAVDNIVNFLDGNTPLWCTGEDGLAVLQWVEKIRGGS